MAAAAFAAAGAGHRPDRRSNRGLHGRQLIGGQIVSPPRLQLRLRLISSVLKPGRPSHWPRRVDIWPPPARVSRHVGTRRRRPALAVFPGASVPQSRIQPGPVNPWPHHGGALQLCSSAAPAASQPVKRGCPASAPLWRGAPAAVAILETPSKEEGNGWTAEGGSSGCMDGRRRLLKLRGWQWEVSQAAWTAEEGSSGCMDGRGRFPMLVWAAQAGLLQCLCLLVVCCLLVYRHIWTVHPSCFPFSPSMATIHTCCGTSVQTGLPCRQRISFVRWSMGVRFCCYHV